LCVLCVFCVKSLVFFEKPMAPRKSTRNNKNVAPMETIPFKVSDKVSKNLLG
jgi:hypothetical protein